jgi:hypothetical protein
VDFRNAEVFSRTLFTRDDQVLRPDVNRVDSYVDYEGSYRDSPFQSPGRYRREIINANYTKNLSDNQKFSLRLTFGRSIDRSNGQVYIPDDGSFQFKGPRRAYGFKTKVRWNLTHHLSLNGGFTKVEPVAPDACD